MCSACVAIDEGRFVDLIEVDAASRTRVDDTRELLDNVQYAPTRGRFKVYLIDEVHMLSKHSFNALLKTLEEPPPHVKFLFATTDPQKLPVTVLSRCLQFNLKRLAVGADSDATRADLRRREQSTRRPRRSRRSPAPRTGSMRDALSLLDQSVAFGAGKVEAALVNAMLGSIDRGHVLRLLEALVAGGRRRRCSLKWSGSTSVRPTTAARSTTCSRALQQHRGAAARARAARRRGTTRRSSRSRRRLSPEDVQLYYQIALLGRRDLPVCRDPRMGFEMTLLRNAGISPGDAGGQARSAARRRPAPGRLGARRPPDATRAAVPPPAPAVGDATPRGRPSRRTTRSSRPIEAVAPARAQRRGEGEARAEAPSSDIDWAALLQTLEVRGPARQLADHCDLVSDAGGAGSSCSPPDKSHLNTQQLRGRLEAALKEHFGTRSSARDFDGTPGDRRPRSCARPTRTSACGSARESIENDPNVRALQSRVRTRRSRPTASVPPK